MLLHKIRPEDYPDDWTVSLLDEVTKRGSGHTPDKQRPEFWNGGIKWVSLADSNKLDRGYIYETDKEISIDGLKNSSAVLLPVNTVVISRDAGVGKSGVLGSEMAVSQHFIAWQCDNENSVSSWFLYYWLQQVKSEIERQAVGSTIKTIGLPYFKKIKFPHPKYPEQQRIAGLISTWSRAIKVTEKLIISSQLQKKALMQQLLTGKRRLPGFAKSSELYETKYGAIPADWSFPQIGEVAVEASERNESGDGHPVLSCSKHKGFVNSLEYFNKKVYSDDTSNYKVIRNGDFGFPSNHVEEGSIGYQDLCDVGIVSPIYTIFRTNDSMHDGYLYKLLKTEHYRQIFAANTNVSVDRRGSLRWKEFSKICVPLPSYDEQAAISAVIDKAEAARANYEDQKASLERQKRALMQQLLTGKRRVKADKTAA